VLERDVSPEYLAALKTKLVRGRMFTEADDAKHPQVTILNSSMAQKYFQGEDPIGKMIGDGDLTPKSMRQVVGVIEDVREGAPDDEAWPAEYFSIYYGPDSSFEVAARTGQDEKALLPVLVKDPASDQPQSGGLRGKHHDRAIEQLTKRPFAPLLHLVGRRVCGDGPGAGSGGPLRGGGVFGKPEDARDRGPDGSGSATGRYPPPHSQRGGMAGWNGNCYRAGLRCGGSEPDAQPALRRACMGLFDHGIGSCGVGGFSLVGQLDPRTTGFVGQSGQSVERRIAESRAGQTMGSRLLHRIACQRLRRKSKPSLFPLDLVS
jgi:hypothetical protein